MTGSRARRFVAALCLAVAAALSVRAAREDTRDVHPAGSRVVRFDVDSRAAGRSLPVTAVVPPGKPRTGRPMLVFLHGRGNDQDGNLDDEMFKALRAEGARAPVVVFPYGDDHSYWHDRHDGAWGRYVLTELMPAAEKRLRTNGRLALGGISMGGFGAYDLAARTGRRLCAVGGHSPALWQSSGETAPGAFDDAGDFARHDVIGVARTRPEAFRRQPVWIDAGTEDPFQPGVRAFVAALRSSGVPVTARTTWSGGHQRSYWKTHWDEYIAFYARRLAECRVG